MIKKITNLFFVLLFFALTSSAQIGLKYGYFIPTDDVKFIYNNGHSVELKFRDYFEDHFRVNTSVGLISCSARQDTIYNLSSYYAGSPGYIVTKVGQVFSNRTDLFATAGLDFTPFEDTKFLPYVGLSLSTGIVFFNYSEYKENGDYKSSEDFTYKYIGARMNIGLEYEVSESVAAFSEITYLYNYEDVGQFSKSYMFGLGLSLYLDL